MRHSRSEGGDFSSCGQGSDSGISSGGKEGNCESHFDLQRGEILTMPLSRTMPSIAVRAEELKIRNRARAYRVFCYATLGRGVLVFHAFTKKSQTTPKHERAMGKKRLKELLDEKD
jgi:hypothetical protein